MQTFSKFTIVLLGLILSSVSPAEAARLLVRIDLSSQSMTVSQDGAGLHRWPISSGRSGYRTPTGVFRPTRLARMWYSRKYNYSPMPHSVFFYGGYAIHGTNYVRRLGRPASHGCIRLHPSHARILYNKVRRFGRSATTIIIQH
ncbi:MAG: L,D-transpeptidase [Pseudomonadota bacterium]